VRSEVPKEEQMRHSSRMVRLVWRMCQVLTLNSHIVSSPVYDDFVVIGQLEESPPRISTSGSRAARHQSTRWMPHSNEPAGWFVDS
jgi:hypothetical protein